MRTVAAGDLGFSLVEVLVAMLILATSAAGVGALCVVAARSTRGARIQTLAAVLAADKMEQLFSLTWDYAPDGSPVSDTTTDLSADPATSFGAGLGRSPDDSLTRNVAGYVDYLDAGGRWVGNGVAPAPGAVFVRRWNIAPLPASPADALVLQVFVASVGEAGRGTAASSAHGALVASVRMRKGR